MHLNLLKQLKKQTNTSTANSQQSKSREKIASGWGKVKVFDDKKKENSQIK